MIESELACLFGKKTVTRAKRTDIVDLRVDADFMDGIADTAGQLLEAKDNPRKQRRLVGSMDQDKRLVLCMWVMDMEMTDRLMTNLYKTDRLCTERS